MQLRHGVGHASSDFMKGKELNKFLKKDIHHLEKIQQAATRWVKGLRGLNYEDRLKEKKVQSLEKIKIRNDLVLIRKILYN